MGLRRGIMRLEFPAQEPKGWETKVVRGMALSGPIARGPCNVAAKGRCPVDMKLAN